MRAFLAVALAAAAGLTVAASASADPPTKDRWLRASPSSTTDVPWDGDRPVERGARHPHQFSPTRWQFQRHGVATLAANGKTLTSNFSATIMFDPTTTVVKVVGTVYNIQVPGAGNVLLDAGNIVMDVSTDPPTVLRVGGPHQQFSGEVGALCEYLSRVGASERGRRPGVAAALPCAPPSDARRLSVRPDRTAPKSRLGTPMCRRRYPPSVDSSKKGRHEMDAIHMQGSSPRPSERVLDTLLEEIRLPRRRGRSAPRGAGRAGQSIAPREADDEWTHIRLAGSILAAGSLVTAGAAAPQPTRTPVVEPPASYEEVACPPTVIRNAQQTASCAAI